MSKLQFISLLITSVSSFVLVILAWLNSNSRLTDLKETMNQRFEQVNQRFEQVNQRFEQVNQRFEQVNQRFAAVDRQFDRMVARLVRIENDQREFYGLNRRL